MAATHDYAASEPSRSEVDALAGPTLLEFGNAWCGHCRRAQPLIDAALADHAAVRHIKIADASRCRSARMGTQPTDGSAPQAKLTSNSTAVTVFSLLKKSQSPGEDFTCEKH